MSAPSVTIWIKWNPASARWQHNHIENGHTQHTTPTIVSDWQRRCWHGALWMKCFGHLVDGAVKYY